MSIKKNNKHSLFESGSLVNLMDMLDAREERLHVQQTFFQALNPKADGSLLLMTMVIPGPIKANQPLNQAFDEMLAYIKKELKEKDRIKELKREKKTGLEYYVLSPLSPREMKKIMVDIEEKHPLGRLFDLDVLFLNEDGEVEGTSRTQLGLPVRRCFVCDRPAKECGRSRRHSVEELQQEISNQISEYLSI